MPEGVGSALHGASCIHATVQPESTRVRPDQRLPGSLRLVRSSLFREAYDQDEKKHGRFMVLHVRRGANATLRLGVVSSRKVGGSVQRVSARRRLREVFRRNRDRLQGQVDIVLIARAAIAQASWDQLVEEFVQLAGKAGILRPVLPVTE